MFPEPRTVQKNTERETCRGPHPRCPPATPTSSAPPAPPAFHRSCILLPRGRVPAHDRPAASEDARVDKGARAAWRVFAVCVCCAGVYVGCVCVCAHACAHQIPKRHKWVCARCPGLAWTSAEHEREVGAQEATILGIAAPTSFIAHSPISTRPAGHLCLAHNSSVQGVGTPRVWGGGWGANSLLDLNNERCSSNPAGLDLHVVVMRSAKCVFMNVQPSRGKEGGCLLLADPASKFRGCLVSGRPRLRAAQRSTTATLLAKAS